MPPAASALASRARALVKRAGLPPMSYWPAAVPGAAPALELAWRQTLKRTASVDVEAQAKQAGIGEIEEVIPCPLCGGREVQPLFHPARGDWSYHVVRCVSCGLLFRSP